MDNKQYAVLGLGIFGSTVATTLANHGYEVIVIDKDPICVQRIADEVTKAIVGDVTDIEELQAAGIGGRRPHHHGLFHSRCHLSRV